MLHDYVKHVKMTLERQFCLHYGCSCSSLRSIPNIDISQPYHLPPYALIWMVFFPGKMTPSFPPAVTSSPT